MLVPWDTPEAPLEVWVTPWRTLPKGHCQHHPWEPLSLLVGIYWGSPQGSPLSVGFFLLWTGLWGCRWDPFSWGCSLRGGSGRVQPETLFQEVLPPARDVPWRGRTWKLFPMDTGEMCGSYPWIGHALVCTLKTRALKMCHHASSLTLSCCLPLISPCPSASAAGESVW